MNRWKIVRAGRRYACNRWMPIFPFAAIIILRKVQEFLKSSRQCTRQSIHGSAAIAFAQKWCVLRYPNEAMAQLSGMSTREFEDFYFDVCTLDYGR